MAVSQRQATVAAVAEALAVLALFITGSILLFGSRRLELFGFETTNGNSNDDAVVFAAEQEAIVGSLLGFVGALLTAYACCAGVLISPLLRDCIVQQQQQQQQQRQSVIREVSLQCSRAAAVSTAAFALCTVVSALGFLNTTTSSSDDNNNDKDSTSPSIPMIHRLHVLMLCVGMAVFALSSASLMASFWPSSSSSYSPQQVAPAAANTSPLAVDAFSRNSNANNHSEEHEPLLLAPSLQSCGETHTTKAEVEDCYQLMEDGITIPTTGGVVLLQKTESPDPAVTHADGGEEVPPSTVVVESSDSTSEGGDDDNISNNNSRLRGTRRLLQLAAPQVLYLYAGCAVLLCRLPFSLAMPHFVSTTLAAVAAADFQTAKHEVLLLLLSGTIDAALDFWGFFLFGYANQRIVRGLRVDLFRRLLGQEVAFFDANSSGELASRLNSDCSEMAGDLTWFFRFSIESVVRITGITTYMLLRSPILGACALSIIPAVAVVNKFYGDWLRHNAVKVQDALAEANSVAQEALSNVRTVIAFVAESQECQRYECRIERQYQLNIKQLYMTALYYMAVSTFLINTIVQGALLWIGTLLIEQDKLTPGVLLAFMLYQSQLQNETLSLMNSYTSLIKSSGAGDKVFALLDRSPPPPSTGNALAVSAANAASRVSPDRDEHDEPNHDDDDDEQRSLLQPRRSNRNQYNVTLENVSFVYPSRPENPVLMNLYLEIPKGQTVALVGSSGSGKTTIVNLLQRFYDPSAGRVTINGVDLRQLDLLEHRRHIGVVTQDPALFRGTLRENILYGRGASTITEAEDQVSAEDVDRAARLANADTFIRDFQHGYETAVGERGVQLSGGQKQRIAIARAVVSQPSLLILDEATSSLDAESETAVQQALDRLLQEHTMTTVVIAHRLRTVKNADKIVVLERGRVVEEGRHDELVLRPNGVYRKMVERAGDSGILPES